MEDVTPTVEYWRWQPQGLPDGVYDNPLFGELVPGRVVEIREDQLPIVKASPDWEKSTVKQYEKQPDIHDEREARRMPTSAQED